MPVASLLDHCGAGQGLVEQGGCGDAGRGGRGGVVVHPRGLPAAVVEQVQLAGQDLGLGHAGLRGQRSEEHTSELQSPIDISYAVFCLKKKKTKKQKKSSTYTEIKK